MTERSDELIIDMIPPRRGYGIVVYSSVIEVGMDESGKESSSDALSIGAYAIMPDAVKAFNDAWDAVLESENITNFHMTDCMSPYPKTPNEFSGWSVAKRVEFVRRLIRVIHSYALCGLVVAVYKKSFIDCDIFQHWDGAVKGLYSFALVSTCLESARIREEFPDAKDKKISFYFEDGHEDRSKADALLWIVREDEELRDYHGYFDHHFAPKGTVRAAQAADMLAWLWNRNLKDQVNDDGPMPIRTIALELTAIKPPAIRHIHKVYGDWNIAGRALEIASSPWRRYLRAAWGKKGWQED